MSSSKKKKATGGYDPPHYQHMTSAINRDYVSANNPRGFSAPGAFIGEQEDEMIRKTVSSISGRAPDAKISTREVRKSDVGHMYVPSVEHIAPLPTGKLSADDAEAMRKFNRNAARAAATRRIEESLLQRADRSEVERVTEEAFVVNEHPNKPPEDRTHVAIPHRRGGRDLPPTPLGFLTEAQAEVLNKHFMGRLRDLKSFVARLRTRVLPFMGSFEEAQAANGVLPRERDPAPLSFQALMQYVQVYLSKHDLCYEELVHYSGGKPVSLMGVAYSIDAYNRFMFCITFPILEVERAEGPNIFSDTPATEDALEERPQGPITNILISRQHVGWFVYTCQCEAAYEYPEEEEEKDEDGDVPMADAAAPPKPEEKRAAPAAPAGSQDAAADEHGMISARVVAGRRVPQRKPRKN